ncbi:unnamed protein product, partial [Staurois parvus]
SPPNSCDSGGFQSPPYHCDSVFQSPPYHGDFVIQVFPNPSISM